MNYFSLNENLNTINKDKIFGVSLDNNLPRSSHIEQCMQEDIYIYGSYLELKDIFLLNTEHNFIKLTFILIQILVA